MRLLQAANADAVSPAQRAYSRLKRTPCVEVFRRIKTKGSVRIAIGGQQDIVWPQMLVKSQEAHRKGMELACDLGAYACRRLLSRHILIGCSTVVEWTQAREETGRCDGMGWIKG